MNRRWTAIDDALLRQFYPDWPTAMLAQVFGRTPRAVTQRAVKLRIGKSAAFLAANALGRFQTGQTPANKGLRRPGWAPGRMAQHQFKPGRPARLARNYKPIGSYRISRDGALEQKVTDDPNVYPARRWKAVARLVWEAAHGPVPAGHVVVFREGRRTTVPAEITLDRIEMISRVELQRRNSIHTRLPPELVDVIRLKAAIKRRLTNRRKRDEEQTQ